MQELIKKAGILIEALPYIQKFSGKTVVIKYGGNAMINEELKNSVMEDITLLKFIGLNPIVVHGGGPDISKALNERGVKSKFVNGLRVTDDITMQTAQQVLIGKTNKEIVALLNTNGGRAVGISGIDGSFIECKKQYTEVDGERVDIGYVGDIVHVKHEIYEMIHDGSISGGMIPKVLGCLESIDGGVTGAHIIDGRIPHCLLLEIFTKTGIGTLIKSDKY